jgi:cobalt transporter subunit CbtA
MWKRVALAAGIAGFLAGVALTAVQQLQVTPLILAGEVIESSLQHRDAQQEPALDPASRLAATTVANVVLATGFALILAAGLMLSGQRGWLAGIAWGAAGYAVFFAAPAIGLPPELPGMESAPLQARTLWWLLAATLTAVGLCVAFFARRIPWRIAGAVIVAIPHLVGAPHGVSAAPPATHDLAAEFLVATALANALLWMLIGLVVGAILRPDKGLPRPAI